MNAREAGLPAPPLQGVVGENEAVANPLAPTHHPAGDDSPSGDKARKLNGHARHA
jgi:hypothetical protein